MGRFAIASILNRGHRERAAGSRRGGEWRHNAHHYDDHKCGPVPMPGRSRPAAWHGELTVRHDVPICHAVAAFIV